MHHYAKGTEAGLPIADIPAGAWYFDAVQYVYDNRLMNGTFATAFSSNTHLNRVMVAQVL